MHPHVISMICFQVISECMIHPIKEEATIFKDEGGGTLFDWHVLNKVYYFSGSKCIDIFQRTFQFPF